MNNLLLKLRENSATMKLEVYNTPYEHIKVIFSKCENKEFNYAFIINQYELWENKSTLEDVLLKYFDIFLEKFEIVHKYSSKRRKV